MSTSTAELPALGHVIIARPWHRGKALPEARALVIARFPTVECPYVAAWFPTLGQPRYSDNERPGTLQTIFWEEIEATMPAAEAPGPWVIRSEHAARRAAWNRHYDIGADLIAELARVAQAHHAKRRAHRRSRPMSPYSPTSPPEPPSGPEPRPSGPVASTALMQPASPRPKETPRVSAKYVLDTHTTVYGPEEEGADERPRLRETSSQEEFGTLREVAAWLRREGLQSPSMSPGPYDLGTWMSLVDPRPHGALGNYTGETDEVTAHPAQGFTDRSWNAVVRSVKWPGH